MCEFARLLSTVINHTFSSTHGEIRVNPATIQDVGQTHEPIVVKIPLTLHSIYFSEIENKDQRP